MEQQIAGFGLQAQEKMLLDYVSNNKSANFQHKEDWIYSDTHSGSDLNRVGLRRLLDDVKKHKFDAVIVFKIDRLSRNLQHLLAIFEEFEKNHVSFISVQENIDFRGPIGKLVFQIFGSIAQFERELIKERTMLGKIASASAGNFTGSYIPYGYKPVKTDKGKRKLEIVSEEQKWVKQIFDWYVFDALGAGQIANKLNSIGVPKGLYSSSKNKYSKWGEKSISNILNNRIYTGSYVAFSRDERGNALPEEKCVIVKFPPCIAINLFFQAQNVRKSKRYTNPNNVYLLSGKLKDMTLEEPRTFVGAKRSKGGYSYRRKQFKKNDEHFPVFEIPAKQIEEFVWGKIKKALEKPEVFIKDYLSKKYSQPDKINSIQNQLASAETNKIELLKEINLIEVGYEKGLYDDKKASNKIAAKNASIKDLDNKIAELEKELSFLGSVDLEVSKLKEASKQINYKLDNLNREQRKILVNLFIERVEMRRNRENAGNKWQIETIVHFRFNPQRLINAYNMGRTDSSLKEAIKSKSIPLEDNHGRGGGT